MNVIMRRIAVWVPWVILAALAGLYLVEAYQVAQREAASWGVMVLMVLVGALLFFPLGLSVEVLEEKTRTGAMTPLTRRLLFWTPRIAAILFCLFLSLFALDVLDMGLSWWETIVALLIHLLPVIGLAIGAVAIAWRWEWVGALLLIGWAVFYLIMAWGSFGPMVYIQMAGLPFVLGVLFWLNWQYRRELKGEAHPPATSPTAEAGG